MCVDGVKLDQSGTDDGTSSEPSKKPLRESILRRKINPDGLIDSLGSWLVITGCSMGTKR